MVIKLHFPAARGHACPGPHSCVVKMQHGGHSPRSLCIPHLSGQSLRSLCIPIEVVTGKPPHPPSMWLPTEKPSQLPRHASRLLGCPGWNSRSARPARPPPSSALLFPDKSAVHPPAPGHSCSSCAKVGGVASTLSAPLAPCTLPSWVLSADWGAWLLLGACVKGCSGCPGGR
jgi:hypothetical protein